MLEYLCNNGPDLQWGALSKKRLQYMYFPVAFEKISRPLFTEHLRAGKSSKFNKGEGEWIKKSGKKWNEDKARCLQNVVPLLIFFCLFYLQFNFSCTHSWWVYSGNITVKTRKQTQKAIQIVVKQVSFIKFHEKPLEWLHIYQALALIVLHESTEKNKI